MLLAAGLGRLDHEMADNLNGEDENDDEGDEEEIEVDEDELNGYEGVRGDRVTGLLQNQDDAELEQYLREFSQGIGINRARTAPLRAGKHLD